MFDRRTPPGVQLLLFFGLMFSFGIGSGIIYGLIIGENPAAVEDAPVTFDPYVDFPRIIFFQLCAYLFATIVFLRLTKQNFTDIIRVESRMKWKPILIIIGIVAVGVFVIDLLYAANYKLVEFLPDNELIDYELQINEQHHQMILANHNVGMLIMNIFVIAVVPAIFEEIAFRGIVQQKIIETTNGQIHFSIFMSSLIFATIHFQPLKLLPMLFMAMCLGYVYHYFRDLKYSMLLHFLHNTVQFLLYFYMIDTATAA